MNRSIRWSALSAVAIACVYASTAAQARDFSLWVHGRNGVGAIGDYRDFAYWGPADVAAGVNKRAVNWDGYSHIATQNFHLRDALDCHCTGTNWCYIAAHSAGDLMVGYALALYGQTARQVKLPDTADAYGRCREASGRPTQTGWNIHWVDVAGGAAGGSELADYSDWNLNEPLVADLKTSTARAMYDHNRTDDHWFYLYAGANGEFHSFLLPGQDDGAVAYHSSGGVSGSSGKSYCNPSDWFCDDLTMSTDDAADGRAKWAFHSVVLRDDGERFDHYTRGAWDGIVGPMRADMEKNAVSGTALLEAQSLPPPGSAERAQLRSLWAARLERALQVTDSYRAASRHPPDAQPIALHADQAYPRAPIVETRPLEPGTRLRDAPADAHRDAVRLRTVQDRVYLASGEAVRLTVQALDARGGTLPLQVKGAAARALAATPGGLAAVLPDAPLRFADDGLNGDAVAGDGVHSAVVAPAALGAYAAHAGLIRIELSVHVQAPGSAAEPLAGRAVYDVIYTPRVPARWLSGVDEALENGELALTLHAQVDLPGRYVITGRIDEADGRPYALLRHDSMLDRGMQAIRLRVAGSLIEERMPAFPLRLRDVQAFRLIENRYPDRELVPERGAPVHTTGVYAADSFRGAPPTDRDDVRRRLARYSQEVARARAQLERLR